MNYCSILSADYDQDPMRSPLVTGVNYAYPSAAATPAAGIVNNFDNQFISALLGQQPLKRFSFM